MAAWLKYERRCGRNGERDAKCRHLLRMNLQASGERDAEKRRIAISTKWEIYIA